MEDYIDIPTTEGESKEEDFIKLKSETPRRIQIIYELSKNIENISTSPQGNA